jgi:site-specific recombinase XerD
MSSQKTVLAQYLWATIGRGDMPTWAEAQARYEAYLIESAVGHGTLAGYVSDLRSLASWLARPDGSHVGPADFTSDDLRGYAEHLLRERGLSPATINRRLQSVRKFCRFAAHTGLRDTDPAQGVALVSRPLGWSPRTLRPADMAQLDEAAASRGARTALRDRAIVQLLMQTGIRARELVELRPGDLELGSGDARLTIRGRGGRPDRNIALEEKARDALQAYLSQDRPSGAVHVFLNREGEALSVRMVQEIVAELGKAAGISVSARILRDTHARELWQETGDLALVVQRMGYLRPETAVKHIAPLGQKGSSTEVPKERPAPSGV